MRDEGLKSIPGAGAATALCMGLAVLIAGTIIAQSVFLASAICGLWLGHSLADEAPRLAGFFASFALRLALGLVQELIADGFSRKAVDRLLDEQLAAIADRGPALVQERGAGACVVDATEGIDRIQTYVAQSIPRRSSLFIVPVILGVALCFFDGLSGLIAFVCLPFIIIFMQLVGHSASDESARRHAGFAQMSNHFLDALRGLSTLSAFGRAQGYGKSVFAASEAFRKRVMRTLRIATLSSTVLDVFATLGLAAVAIMLGFRMVDGDVSFFPALCVLLLMPEFFMPIRTFGQGYHATLDGKTALADIQKVILAAKSAPCQEAERESIEREQELERALRESGAPRVRLEGVSASHVPGRHVLSSASLDLTGAHIVVLTGPSGAGKSTLLDILSGMADPTSGVIFVNGQAAETLKRPGWRRRVASIPQKPHIFNATVRQNAALYDPDATDEQVADALRAVGLAHLADGPDALAVMLGDGGRQLSGGEAHRIAFARALMDQKRDVIVLDEPTEDVDVLCERDLMGIVARMPADKLIIIATHRTRWLDLADLHVHVEDGVVACERTEPRFTAASSDSPDVAVLEGWEPVEDGKRVFPEKARFASSASGGCVSAAAGNAERGMHHRGRALVFALLREHGVLFAFALGLSVIAALFACGLMFTSGYMIAVAAALPLSALALHIPSLFVRIFGVGKPLLDYLQRLLSHDWVLRATSSLRMRLFDAVQASHGRGIRAHAGELLATLVEDIKATQDFFIRCLEPALRCLIVIAIVGGAACAFSLAWGSALLVLLLASSLALGFLACITDKKALARDDQLRHGLSVRLADQILGLRDLILSGTVPARREEIMALHGKRAACQAQLMRRSALRAFASQLIMGAAVLLTILWAASAFAPATAASPLFPDASSNSAVETLSSAAVINERPLPANWLVAFSIGLFPLIEFLLPMTDAILAGSIQRKHIRHLSHLVNGAPRQASKASQGERREMASEAAPADAGVAIQIEHGSIGYPTAPRPLFADLSLTIRTGEKVCILGPSGAGKTTLARAIADVAVPLEGRVRVRGQVGLIEQDAYIFNKSLRENLLIANGAATDAELERALGQVGLEGLLHRLPQGLDSVLAADGEDLSGGEGRRITVARALLAGFDTVIFDEPFKGLDEENARSLFQTIDQALSDRTVLIITHRLEGVEQAERLLFVRDGAIEEWRRTSPVSELGH